MKKLKDKIKALLLKCKEQILYLFFGALTTLLSYVVFLFFTEILTIGKSTLNANILSNVAGIIFAYCTNRKWVFKSDAKGVVPVTKEFFKFASGRVVTMLLDLAFVFLAVDVFKGNGAIWKLVSNVVVIILNYLISKFLVFV